MRSPNDETRRTPRSDDGSQGSDSHRDTRSPAPTRCEVYREVRAEFLTLRRLPPESREERLRRISSIDSEVYRQVSALLERSDSAVGFLDTPALGPAFSVEHALPADSAKRTDDPAPGALSEDGSFGSDSGLPARIGGYRILSLLGRGGMSTVFVAEQKSPRRRVALKVIRTGLVDPDLRRRFELEAELLARLHHPCIARVFESGSTETDSGPRSFIAMELVDGRNLTEHVRSHATSPRDRIELLARIADAVHHAHQRGIIHRDLKPGNILVDEGGRPKILDFGVARLVDRSEGHRTTTVGSTAGRLLGTLPYMSPEQLRGSSDLDTSTDVYSLGVIAYELLATDLPYDLDGCSLVEAVRVLYECAPKPLRATCRDIDPDLEAVVLQALDKDRERRYASAAEMAHDLRRYLRYEPVLARRAGLAYRARKWVRRHSRSIQAALLIGIAASSATLGAATQAKRSRTANDAVRHEAQQAHLERTVESDKSAALARLLDGALSLADPVNDRGARDSVEVLRQVADALDGTDQPGPLAEHPVTEADVRHRLGVTFRHAGHAADARVQFERAILLRSRHLGRTDVRSVRSLHALAVLDHDTGRYDEAERSYVETIARLAEADAIPCPTIESVRTDLAKLHVVQGRVADAERLARTVLSEHPGCCRAGIDALGVVARVLSLRRDHAAAAAAYEELFALTRGHGEPDDASALAQRNNYGILLEKTGRYDESVRVHEETLEIRRRRLPATHPDVLESMHNLAGALGKNGEVERAISLLRTTIDGRTSALGDEHPRTLASKHNLARLVERTSPEEAEVMLADIVTSATRSLPEGHWHRGLFRVNHGAVLATLGEFDAAADELALGLSILTESLGADHEETRAAESLLRDVFERAASARTPSDSRLQLRQPPSR